jgi:hypothetical protein
LISLIFTFCSHSFNKFFWLVVCFSSFFKDWEPTQKFCVLESYFLCIEVAFQFINFMLEFSGLFFHVFF